MTCSSGQGKASQEPAHRGTSRRLSIFLDACGVPHARTQALASALLAVSTHSKVQGRSGPALAAPQAGKPAGKAHLHFGRAPAELDARCCLESTNGGNDLPRLQASTPARRKAASNGHARAPLAMILQHRSLWVRPVHWRKSRRLVAPRMLPVTQLQSA